jgi:sensor histidine kinase YesM
MPEQEEIGILIRFERQGDQLVCVIDDNGIGIEASIMSKTEATRAHQGVGIENIQSRIELLNKKHNRKSSLTLEDKAKWNGGHESGTRVTLRLPIELNEDE